ncbi:Crp/Fnr family transcriptional regulator [Actinoplanes sp. HUAS TT8]|uniref:Crp/Fnr family transcriptional regulator n=1 Tax=Actinoplanes sp. HUAS TT8 TaxID=3447453 RepID=UPI003F521528
MSTQRTTAARPHWPAGSLLAMLTPADRAGLLTLGTRRALGRDETLIREGDDGDSVHVLLDGLVKVSGDTYDGRTTVLAIRVPGDLIGELAVMDGGRRSATVTACTAVTVRSVDRAAFDTYLDSYPAAAVAVRQSVAAKLREATRLRIDLSGASAQTGVARVLHQLAERHGRPDPAGRVVDVPLSEGDLAAMIGISLASVQRALAELKRLGLITRTYRRTVVTDPRGLAEFGRGTTDPTGRQ